MWIIFTKSDFFFLAEQELKQISMLANVLARASLRVRHKGKLDFYFNTCFNMS